jgi:hypothetical protein
MFSWIQGPRFAGALSRPTTGLWAAADCIREDMAIDLPASGGFGGWIARESRDSCGLA